MQFTEENAFVAKAKRLFPASGDRRKIMEKTSPLIYSLLPSK
jgi:hypothetical protein